MRNSIKTRPFAEAMGQAMAFGHAVTTCDIFQSPVNSGYVHGTNEPHESQSTLEKAFGRDQYDCWMETMRHAEDMASERGHDPCTYGVMILRTGNLVFMKVVRHTYVESRALETAQLESFESEVAVDAVYNIERFNSPIHLQQHAGG